MSHSDWPTVEDVQARYTDMGLTAPSEETIESELLASITAWENVTNYHPFIGSGSAETDYLTASGCLIDFGGGLTAAPTSLTINGNYDDDGNYQNGTELVINRDYILMPENSLRKGQPFTYCKLKRFYANGEQGGIKLVAPFGFSVTVPDDVWEAIMKDVLLRLTPVSTIATTGGYDSIKQGPVEWRNQTAGGSFQTSSELLSSEANRTAASYRRIVVV